MTEMDTPTTMLKPNSTSTTNARPPRGPQATKSPGDELRTLKAAVNDLQSKRLTALRLYHEERAQKQLEVTRADALSDQLHALQQSMRNNCGQASQSESNHSPVTCDSENAKGSETESEDILMRERSHVDSPVNLSARNKGAKQNRRCVLRTEALLADVVLLGRFIHTIPASLTWHSLSLSDVLPQAASFVALPQPSNGDAFGDALVHNNDGEDVKGDCKGDSEFQKMSSNDHMENQFCNNNSSECQTEINQLREKLEHAEEECARTHEELMKSQQLILELKEQLDASTRACKELIDTINEQEDTISHLS